MKVTAKINLLENSTSKVKALASITIEDCFVVTGIRIIESANGTFFSAMPSRQTANGEYKDVCFPITAEARNEINNQVLSAYKQKINEVQSSLQTNNIKENYYNNNFGFSDNELPF